MMSREKTPMGRWTRYGFALAAALVAASVGMLACDEPLDGAGEVPECAPPAGAVSVELLAFLSRARSLHTKADLAVDADNPEAAVESLDELVQGVMPPGEPSPEVREVLADTLARSAELRSNMRQTKRAKEDIARGLEFAPERTYFRGRLLGVLGVIESRVAKDLAEAGDAAGAESAKARAITALNEEIDIQEEVINRSLSEDMPPSP